MKFIIHLRLLIPIFIFLVFNKSETQAAVGCQAKGYIYVNGPSGWTEWSNATQVSCPNNASNSDQFAKFASYTSTPATTCYVGFWGFGGAGKLVNYNLVNCPIDDYIPHMLLGVSGLGFLFIRRRLLFATATD